MKLIIITDATGKVTGLARFNGGESEGSPTEVRITPSDGQMVYEIELPPELEHLKSPIELYSTLEQQYAIDTDTARLIRTVPHSFQ